MAEDATDECSCHGTGHDERVPRNKYEGAGTTFWINEKGQRVEMNKAFSDEQYMNLIDKGWRPAPVKAKYMP